MALQGNHATQNASYSMAVTRNLLLGTSRIFSGATIAGPIPRRGSLLHLHKGERFSEIVPGRTFRRGKTSFGATMRPLAKTVRTPNPARGT